MKVGGKLLAAAVAAMGLVVPATANAALSVKITDDTGNPALIAPGAPPTLRNMDVKAYVNTSDGKGFSVAVAGPDGQPAGSALSCGSPGIESTRYVDYHGNGTYTLLVTAFSDIGCTKATGSTTYTWNIAAGVAISPPAPTMLTRQPNSYSTIVQQFNFAGNPGASGYEIKYALGATVNPDGSLNSPAIKDGFVNSTTGKVELIGAREPGTYTIVARAKSLGYFTPWTAPQNFNLITPFDISSRTFPDSRGPSYQVRATLGDASAAGSRVTVAVANGKKGKRFRTLGKPKINSKGQITLRFRLKVGTYRMRYSFKGNSLMARGTVYDVIRIKRVLG
ncbi:hypothetical protein [Solirubrobacter soli]|uniref:hypothetical protein n=1 Tax=Solirubrobacter soli TaxID=363832 RepID=UPI00040BBD0B|nr:hypothetical protein [Solirubrobacter soli]